MFAQKLQETQEPVRHLLHRTKGHTGGPITRLVSPSDLGGIIKPFVFLDHFVFDQREDPTQMELGWHPHSGIATVTVLLDGSVRYAETTGKAGVLPAGSIEWMRAGNGVWHTGGQDKGPVRGFQLWVALPPELENAPNASHYVLPEEVPAQGPVRLILGEYDGLKSPIAAPPMTYLAVNLKAGEKWSYRPPKGHTVAWIAVDSGRVLTPSPVGGGELAIFEPSDEAIDFVAQENVRFVLGSAVQHPHDLVLGSYSVHTTREALRQGEAEIRRVGNELCDQGKRSYALQRY